MSRNRISLLALLVASVFSAQGMQLKKMDKVLKKGFTPIKFYALNKVDGNRQERAFHNTSSLVKIKSSDKDNFLKKNGKMLSILSKFKNDKKIYYFDVKDVKVVENGILGANIGFQIGWWTTNVVAHGVIFVGCRVADCVVPGSGAAAEVGLHAAAAPYVATAAAWTGAGIGLATGVATGPA